MPYGAAAAQRKLKFRNTVSNEIFLNKITWHREEPWSSFLSGDVNL